MTPQEKLILQFLLSMMVIGLVVGLVRNRWHFEALAQSEKAETMAKAVAAIAEKKHAQLLAETEEGQTQSLNSNAVKVSSEIGNVRVNLNTASKSDLVSLPGIGPAMAERIILYRQDHGSFKTVNDLLKIRGIGQKTLEKLRGLVTI